MSAEPLYLPAAEGQDQPSDDAMTYADRFVPLAQALDACAHGGDVALLLSTCRNQWMTVNAAYVDLKAAVGATDRPDRLSYAIELLGERLLEQASRELDGARAALREIDEKLRVWATREPLMAEFEAAIGTLEPRDADHLRRLVERQRFPASSDGHDADGRFLMLSTVEDADGRALLDEVRRVRELLGAVVRACVGVHDALAPWRATLEDDGVEDPGWERLSTRLGSPVDGSPVDAGHGRRTTAELLRLQQEVPAQRPSAEATAELVRHVLERAHKVVGEVQDELFRRFRPNVSRSPMPEPYVIDLSPVGEPGVRRRRRFRVERHRGNVTPTPDETRIALLRCGVPDASYSKDHAFRYLRERARDDTRRVEEIALAALGAAADAGARILAMPECFLPESAVDAVTTHAEQLGVGIVAGVEYASQSSLANKAIVQLPGMPLPVAQLKQRPSVYESQVGFDSDDVLRIFVDTDVGCMATVVCSDYLDLDLVFELASQDTRLDVLFVCARNPNPDVFRRLGAADAARLNAYVVIVNSLDGGDDDPAGSAGTDVLVPAYRDDDLSHALAERRELDVAEWGEIEPPSIDVYSLRVAELASARDRGKPLKGLLPAPAFVKLDPSV